MAQQLQFQISNFLSNNTIFRDNTNRSTIYLKLYANCPHHAYTNNAQRSEQNLTLKIANENSANQWLLPLQYNIRINLHIAQLYFSTIVFFFYACFHFQNRSQFTVVNQQMCMLYALMVTGNPCEMLTKKQLYANSMERSKRRRTASRM